MAERKKGRFKPTYVPIERRQHQRKEVALPIVFQIISGRFPAKRSAFKQATLIDISMGGLCFETPEILVDELHISFDFDEQPFEDNKVMIEVALPPPMGPITVIGQAVWFRQVTKGETIKYIVGVRFLEFYGEGSEKLFEFLKDPP